MKIKQRGSKSGNSLNKGDSTNNFMASQKIYIKFIFSLTHNKIAMLLDVKN